WKVGFYNERRDWWTPPAKVGVPKAFDLITDSKEEYPATALRSSWNAGPAMRIVAEFEQSLKKHPPIAPGTPDPYTPPRCQLLKGTTPVGPRLGGSTAPRVPTGRAGASEGRGSWVVAGAGVGGGTGSASAGSGSTRTTTWKPRPARSSPPNGSGRW